MNNNIILRYKHIKNELSKRNIRLKNLYTVIPTVMNKLNIPESTFLTMIKESKMNTYKEDKLIKVLNVLENEFSEERLKMFDELFELFENEVKKKIEVALKKYRERYNINDLNNEIKIIKQMEELDDKAWNEFERLIENMKCIRKLKKIKKDL